MTGGHRRSRVPPRPTTGQRADSERWLIGFVAALALLLVGAIAFAADAYPPLTGRVVDGAHLLPDATTADLDKKLDALEAKSGIQLVVATIPSLGGQEIEPYANALFRFWKLGEAKKNNGALLLVAPTEHRVRIEVGYGLEGTLTDALSKIIIANGIVPRFKTGDFAGGIVRGTDDIITVLSTDTSDWQKRPEFRAQSEGGQIDGLTIAIWVVIVIIVLFYMSRQMGRRPGGGPGGGIVFLPTSGASWGGGGGFSGGGGGGGFSGGGGSSGGGGASGGW